MKPKFVSTLRAGVLALLFVGGAVSSAQQSFTWDQVKARFEASNPTLKENSLLIDEARAQEITAYLRPNPDLSISTDGTQIIPNNGIWKPLAGTSVVPNVSYLHERDHKRELRLESAKEGTRISQSQFEDAKRNLEFALRVAFVNTLQAKALVELAKSELVYYDHVIEMSRDRLHAGDIAQVDFDRIELQRVQYESALQSATVNLRTAKIQLLQLLNDRTPVEQFDFQGNFGFSDSLKPLEEYRQIALDARPDLQAAIESAQQAETNHKLAIANGSTDPTYGLWYTYNSSNNNPNGIQTIGASVSIPLRIFDRNQGEKLRTRIDIDRNRQATDAARAQVFSDVDSAYTQVESNIQLLKPYKDKYTAQAAHVRDAVTYAYQHGGASLMDFLSAQSDYRQVEQAYLQLIGAYMTASAQLNLAVGREVIQ